MGRAVVRKTVMEKVAIPALRDFSPVKILLFFRIASLLNPASDHVGFRPNEAGCLSFKLALCRIGKSRHMVKYPQIPIQYSNARLQILNACNLESPHSELTYPLLWSHRVPFQSVRNKSRVSKVVVQATVSVSGMHRVWG